MNGRLAKKEQRAEGIPRPTSPRFTRARGARPCEVGADINSAVLSRITKAPARAGRLVFLFLLRSRINREGGKKGRGGARPSEIARLRQIQHIPWRHPSRASPERWRDSARPLIGRAELPLVAKARARISQARASPFLRGCEGAAARVTCAALGRGANCAPSLCVHQFSQSTDAPLIGKYIACGMSGISAVLRFVFTKYILFLPFAEFIYRLCMYV